MDWNAGRDASRALVAGQKPLFQRLQSMASISWLIQYNSLLIMLSFTRKINLWATVAMYDQWL